MPEISLNSDYSLKINIDPSSQTPSMAEIKKGFDNIAEAMNEVLYQSAFLGDGGFGSSFVTGAQLIVTLTGIRMIGDAAQDYIFSNKVYFGVAKARETTMVLSSPDETTITCPVTLAKIVRSGGAGNNGTAISVEVHFNGKPTIINTKLASLTIGSLTLSPIFDAEVLNYTATASGTSDTVTAVAQDTANTTISILNGSTNVNNGSTASWTTGANKLKIIVTNDTYSTVYNVTVTK